MRKLLSLDFLRVLAVATICMTCIPGAFMPSAIAQTVPPVAAASFSNTLWLGVTIAASVAIGVLIAVVHRSSIEASKAALEADVAKFWLKSKTVLVNLFVMVASAGTAIFDAVQQNVGALQGNVPPIVYVLLMGAIAGVNFWLRSRTTSPISFTKPSAPPAAGTDAPSA